MRNVIDINDARLLVASDIRGNWDNYRKIRDTFQTLRREGEADVLVLNGNLIQGSGGYQDRSLQILDDLIDNPQPNIITLLGNREFFHIYNIAVVAGGHDFTEQFEDQIERDREKYVGFMQKMPYAIRTRGGVVINHAGANHAIAKSSYNVAQCVNGSGFLDGFDHGAVVAKLKIATRLAMEKELGSELADDFFDDYSPQIGQVFAQTSEGRYLLDVFTNGNEASYGAWQYDSLLMGFIEKMSGRNRPQRHLMSGNMLVPGEYQMVGGLQLRLGSSGNAEDSSRVLGLVDASRRYPYIDELVDDLVPLKV